MVKATFRNGMAKAEMEWGMQFEGMYYGGTHRYRQTGEGNMQRKGHQGNRRVYFSEK